MIEDNFFSGGIFSIHGVTLREVLERYKTPLYIYSAEVIKDKYRRVQKYFPTFDIFYSFKANPNPAICKKLLSMGAKADTSSLGELNIALGVGFKPENILLVGPGKTEEEISFAIKKGIYGIIAESPSELNLIETTARKFKKSVDVLLRINTLRGPETPEVMAGVPSKFGFDEEHVAEQIRQLKFEKVKLSGIHAYTASQILDEQFIGDHIENILSLSLRLSKELDFCIKCIDFGGGFGVPYGKDERELNLPQISKRVEDLLERPNNNLSNCRLVFELGRYIVAESGIFVTKVVRIKESRGKHFIITDGGMNHFTRTAFLKVNHPVKILNKFEEEIAGEFDVCGPCCTPFDVIACGVELPKPEEGDVIGIFNAGAYGYTMSMLKFLSFGYPQEIIVDNGKPYLISDETQP